MARVNDLVNYFDHIKSIKMPLHYQLELMFGGVVKLEMEGSD